MGAVTVSDDALLGVLAAFKSLPRDMAKQVQKQTKATVQPAFRNVYAGHISTAQDRRMAGAGTASLTAGGKGTLRGYTSGRALSGGMTPATDWPFVEFGSLGPHGRRGQLPMWRKGGRIFFPTTAKVASVAQRAYLFAVYETLRGTGAEDT